MPPEAPQSESVGRAALAMPAVDDGDNASMHSRHTLRTLPGSKYRPHSALSAPSSPSLSDGGDPWSSHGPGRGRGHDEDGLDEPDLDANTAALLARARTRTLLRASAQLAALFVVCTVGLGGTLWVALPVIDE